MEGADYVAKQYDGPSQAVPQTLMSRYAQMVERYDDFIDRHEERLQPILRQSVPHISEQEVQAPADNALEGWLQNFEVRLERLERINSRIFL